ncbi:MAG: type II secretion system protein [Alphaproteobacteria bacterium]|nr:type II secretion system protein [Alphaproteobacteria bacterium]
MKQSGRSMIEMLGVLAIIGVLTVGSITAYSRAMRRHLLNKQREQISYILSAAETHHDIIFANSLPSTNLMPIFKTFGWIPEEMIKDDSNYIYDVFKNRVSFGYVGSEEPYLDLTLELAHDNPHEQCINLYQMIIKQYHSFLWLTEVYKYTNEGHYTNKYFGDKYCGRLCIRDLTPTEISELCRVCDDARYCRFVMLGK